jgi:hypothetical protein
MIYFRQAGRLVLLDWGKPRERSAAGPVRTIERPAVRPPKVKAKRKGKR